MMKKIEYKIPIHNHNANGTLYTAKDILPHSVFSEETIRFRTEGENYIIEMPPHSMALFIQK